MRSFMGRIISACLEKTEAARPRQPTRPLSSRREGGREGGGRRKRTNQREWGLADMVSGGGDTVGEGRWGYEEKQTNCGSKAPSAAMSPAPALERSVSNDNVEKEARVWFATLGKAGLQVFTPLQHDEVFQKWWWLAARRMPIAKGGSQKGFHSLVVNVMEYKRMNGTPPKLYPKKKAACMLPTYPYEMEKFQGLPSWELVWLKLGRRPTRIKNRSSSRRIATAPCPSELGLNAKQL
ncbi:hypothetical protein U9M48_017349 [Paspalum notatum var. saurae]|uniref:Uncharacterized protein n=1 Tax=Paspalum notatum var. saurae TaxID=547442 RepID=A0AAQ3WP86_PASNO